MQEGSHVSAAEIKKMGNGIINIGLSRCFVDSLSIPSERLSAMCMRECIIQALHTVTVLDELGRIWIFVAGIASLHVNWNRLLNLLEEESAHITLSNHAVVEQPH